MPNIETVRALVSAFNVHNYARNTVKTNFTLQSRDGKDYIVVSFDEGMKDYQCSEYLYNVKRKIVGEFYGIEEGDTDEVVLNTAKLIFDVKSFPFNTSKGKWFRDEQNGLKLVTPVDKGVIFNLKSHLASSLKKDVIEDMPICHMVTEAFNKEKYLCHSKFPDKESRKQFEREFLFRMKERYENVPKNPLKVEGNSVYIKDVFDNARFIDSVTRYIAWLEGMGLQDDSKNYSEAKAFKDLIIEFIDQSIGLTVAGFIRNFPLNEKTAKVLIPVVLDNGEPRILASEEALKLNYAFNYAVFNDLYGKTQGEISTNGSSEVYGIDFSNKEISHCVITKIIESSVINKDHELAIDPELRLQALSPAQSPVRVPNGPSSSLTGTSTQGFPTQSQGGALKESPRRESEKFPVLLPVNQLDVPGTSRKFLQSTQLSFPTVSCGVLGPSSSLQSVGAAQNVPASTNLWTQQPSTWSSQSTSGNKWPSLSKPGLSGLLWKGTNESGSAWTSAPSHWSFSGPYVTQKPTFLCDKDSDDSRLPGLLTDARPIFRYSMESGSSSFKSTPAAQRWSFSSPLPPPFIPISSNVSGSQPPTPSRTSSWKGANESGSAWTSQPIGFWSSQSSNVKEDCKKICEDFEEAYEKIVSGSSLSEKEEKLSKALLYWFNLNNYALDPPHTNFIVKNGKIASLIDDSVNVKEYLQEIIDKTKEEYRVNEKEGYDLNEFPFQFLSNCEKNQEITVVANIRRGALLNLKKLFSRGHEGKVEIKDIDINIVEKAVKSEKGKWVNFQVQEHGLSPEKAIQTCYPGESVLEYISITKDKGGYWINRDYDSSEVESFRKEQWPAKGISKAEKMKPEDNKDSGYSSGFVTDAENVSSKAEATTSGYESMDCENTRGGSPKRKSPEPLAGSSTTKKTRSESDSSSFEGGVGSPRPGFSGSTIEQVREQLNKTGI